MSSFVTTRRPLRLWNLGAIGVALVMACTPPDRPDALAPNLPGEALDHLRPDSLRSFRLGDGVFYYYVWTKAGPWAAHVVRADMRRCDVGLRVVPALGEDGATRQRRAVSGMVPGGPVGALAGVNGDFFGETGAPLGSEVTSITRRLSGRPALAWSPGAGSPWIGPPLREEGHASFGPLVVAEGPDGGGLQVVSGFPELLDGGGVVGDLEVSRRPAFAAGRHPRTGVGFDTESGTLWVVVVDGRQAPHSVGMSLPELAELFLALGADEALNLDGGGSSAMSLHGQLVNRPSDASGERPVGNSLWLVTDDGACDP